jgi:hypothetical protein
MHQTVFDPTKLEVQPLAKWDKEPDNQLQSQPRKPGSLLPLPSLTRSSRDPGSGWSCDTPESGMFALFVT